MKGPGGSPPWLRDLMTFLAIPSVSADPARHADVRRAARWLAGHLRRAGADAQILATGGLPAVLATWPAVPGRPTVLLYAHHDVESADSRGWLTPPFRPRVIGDRLVGRGSADDKGQLFIQLRAIASLRRRPSGLPVNVVLLVDGEEEIGSPGLARLLARPGPWWQASAAIATDSRLSPSGRPVIVASHRGLLELDIEVTRPGGPVHAGQRGSRTPDPGATLSRILGRVTSTPPSPGAVVTITGLASGAGGAGGSSVVPVDARASLDIRVPPGTPVSGVAAAVRRSIGEDRPHGLGIRVRTRATIPPVSGVTSGRLARLAGDALLAAFGVRPAIEPSGGSSGGAAAISRVLGIPVLLLGFATPDARFHGVNENLHLPTAARGVEALTRLLSAIGEGPVP